MALPWSCAAFEQVKPFEQTPIPGACQLGSLSRSRLRDFGNTQIRLVFHLIFVERYVMLREQVVSFNRTCIAGAPHQADMTLAQTALSARSAPASGWAAAGP